VTDVASLVIDRDEKVGEGGFLALRRLHLRNRRPDGSLSRGYLCDYVLRPYGQDAVVVAIFDAQRRVLVRECLRPALHLGRDPDKAPLPEAPAGLTLTELVAGIIEQGDRGEDGLRTRAAHEVLEEAGFVVDPARVILLGRGLFPSPGSMVEKFHFAAALVDPSLQQALEGDGSPMEEGASTRWIPIDEAIAMCMRGEIADLKTELGLRRLRDLLG
jgi:ADP-ribose pyrophosphatase